MFYHADTDAMPASWRLYNASLFASGRLFDQVRSCHDILQLPVAAQYPECALSSATAPRMPACLPPRASIASIMLAAQR
jgi:hypothetical protein